MPQRPLSPIRTPRSPLAAVAARAFSHDGFLALGLLAMASSACGTTAATSDAGRGGDGAAVVERDAGIRDLSMALSTGADLAGADAATGAPGALFPVGAPYNTAVDKAPLDSESKAVTAGLLAAGGWGNGNRFQIDFSLVTVEADANTPLRSFTKTADFYSPDCDDQPVPLPPGGAVEGESGYACTGDGDCHLLVIDRPHQKLYEMWRADVQSNTVWNGGCLAVWDLSRVYPPSGRGEQCTSADAGGFAITPLLVRADEVWAAAHGGPAIGHALRFILPNSRIRKKVYVHPGTHSTGPTSGGPTLPPYGARFRLRADYPLASLPNDAARAVARALQTYGMFLADGGNIALTFESDRFAQHKWTDLGFDSHALFGISPTDFEMVDGGARIAYTGDCQRNP